MIAQELQDIGGRVEETPTALQRIGNTLIGGLRQSGAGYVNTLGTVENSAAALHENSSETDKAVADNPYSGYATDDLTASNMASAPKSEETSGRIAEMRTEAGKIFDTADTMSARAENNLSTAKRGLGKVGNFLVDVGSQAVQMIPDAAANAVLPGSGVALMGTRSFGQGAQEARQAGASEGKQALYGIGNAAVEMLTEKIADGVAGIYGKGAADDLVEKAIGKLASTDAGRTALRTVTSMLGEGAEEFIADAVNPVLRTIYNDKTVRENYSDEQISQWLYDALVGAAMGGLGSGVNIVNGKNAQVNAKIEAEQMEGINTASLGFNSITDGLELIKANNKANADNAQIVTEQAAVNPQANGAEMQKAPKAPIQPATENMPTEAPAMSQNTEGTVTPTAEEKPAVKATVEAQQTDSTSVNDNPDTHTKEEIEKIEEYKNSTDANLVEYVENVKSNPNAKHPNFSFLPVSERAAAGIKKITGIDTAGNRTVLEARMVKHIYKRHGESGKSDHSMSDVNDIGRIQYVLDNFDNITDGGTSKAYVSNINGKNVLAKTVIFEKAIDGSIYVVEAVPDTAKKTNYIVSAYINKKTAASSSVDAEAPRITPESATMNTAIDTVSQPSKAVNEKTLDSTVSSGNAIGSDSFTDYKPQEGEGKVKQMQTPTTAKESVATPEPRKQELEKHIVGGAFNYVGDSNKAQADRATARIERDGWSKAAADFQADVDAGRASADLVALGAVLINNIGNSNAEAAEYMDLTQSYIDLMHSMGRAEQAGKILQKITPEGRLYMMQRTVNKINDSLTDKQKQTVKENNEAQNNLDNMQKTVGDNISIPPELAEKYMNAQTEAERNNVVKEIQQAIADQIPATFMDKYTALRYVNMLGNLKTQGRNIVGNILMGVTSKVKRRVQSLVETAYKINSEDYEKNTSFIVPRELKKQAVSDFENVKDAAMGNRKYNDANSLFMDGIKDKQTIFKFKPLEKYRTLTTDAMEIGDEIFVRAQYADALGGYMKAHGFKNVSDMSESQLSKAREFAIKEAQEATFRDNNAVTDWVSKIGRRKDTPKAVKAMAEGVMPFRKTPANVAIRALEYSPLGFAETVYKGIQTKKGNATAADVINSAAKSMTGSALFAAGMIMAAAGRATGGSDDNDKGDKFDRLGGKQDWSIKIGDTYISLAQFAPAAIPFFMGVQLQQGMDGELTTDDLMLLVNCVADPMLDMSMLSGINDTFNNIAETNGDFNAVGKLAINSMLGYLSQGMTNTLLGQVEQASEKNRQTTYSESGKFLSSDMQYNIGKIAAKTPLWDYNQQDYVDAWGRKQSNGNTATRLFNSFINPTYTSKDRSTEIDAELQRLYQDNKNTYGFPNVLPQKASRSMEYAKGKTMTADEYMQYSIDRGQKSLELVTDFVKSDEYKSMTDLQRASVISDLYNLAADRALKTVRESNKVTHKSDWDDEAKLEDPVKYIATKKIADDYAENNNASISDTELFKVMLGQNFSKKDIENIAAETLSDSQQKTFNALMSNFGQKKTADYYTKLDSGQNDSTLSLDISKTVKGSDAEKMKVLKAYNAADGKTQKNQAIVRRFEAAINTGYYTFDQWAQLEASAKAEATKQGKSSPTKAIIKDVAGSLGLEGWRAYNVWQKYSGNEDYVTMYDPTAKATPKKQSKTVNASQVLASIANNK